MLRPMSAPRLLLAMHTEGQARWPAVPVSVEQYRVYCEGLCGERSLYDLQPLAADLYLCCACVQKQPLAQRTLEREATEVVRGAVSKVHRDSEFIRDTLQDFWRRVLVGPDAKIHAYRAQGPLHAWLRIAAMRLAIDRLRSQQAVRTREAELGDSMAEQAFGPESSLTLARFHEPFRVALRECIAALSPRDRNLLRMHVQGHCSIDQIGRVYGVHRATAARWLEQVKKQILLQVQARVVSAGPKLTDSEFRSIAKLVGAELELGLSAETTKLSPGVDSPMS